MIPEAQCFSSLGWFEQTFTIHAISHTTFHVADHITYSPVRKRETTYFGDHDWSRGFTACVTVGTCNRKAWRAGGPGGVSITGSENNL